MKKFRYRLEGLLKIKEHIERERQKEHAESMQKVQDQKTALTDLDNTRLQATERQRSRQTGALSIAELLIFSRYIVRLKKERLTGNEFLRALEKESEERRRRLVDASRERKKYDKLKDKLRERHDTGLERDMAKENDEIALNTFRRSRTPR